MFIGQSPRVVVYVMITVSRGDGTELVARWRGRSVRIIRAAAKAAYPGCKLAFSRSWQEHYWGAH